MRNAVRRSSKDDALIFLKITSCNRFRSSDDSFGNLTANEDIGEAHGGLPIFKVEEQGEAAPQRDRGRAQYLAPGFGEIFQGSLSSDDACPLFSGIGNAVANWHSFGVAPVQERMRFLVVVLENWMPQLHRFLLSGYTAVRLSPAPA